MKVSRKHIATLALMMAMFLNPLGFDIAVAMVMSWTGSYWITMAIFYLASAICFGVYFGLAHSSPRNILKQIRNKFGRTK